MRLFQRSNKQRSVADASTLDADAVESLVEMDIQPSQIGERTAPKPTAPAISFEPTAAAEPSERRRPNAGRTRLIGFDTSDGREELFNEDEVEEDTPKMFKPVGWLVVTAGAGCGHAFALRTGMSTIGRGADQTVTLDFGDEAISRSNHAAVVYEPGSNEFLLGHGGKANIVRLNGKPLVSTEELGETAEIQIGETTMRFVALCNKDFTWSEKEAEDDANVAFI